MTISATATFNNTTNKVNIAYELTGNYSFYICWSDTTTDDYSALISGGHYDLVSGQQSGTWSETANPPSAGNTRYYYFVDPYSYSLITSTSYTALAITDFDASLVTGGTLCTFTAPAGIETTCTVAWQRSTDNSNFTTIQTTDLSGTAVTV